MAITKTKQQTLNAVYEHGTFKPLHPEDVKLAEGQQVRLIVEAEQPSNEEDLLEAMFHFFDDLPKEEVHEIQKIILDRRDFFGEKSA